MSHIAIYCAYCRKNETYDNDLYRNTENDLFDNIPDFHQYIVDLSLNLTKEELDTKESYSTQEIVYMFKDVSYDFLEPFFEMTRDNSMVYTPSVFLHLIEETYSIFRATQKNILNETSDLS